MKKCIPFIIAMLLPAISLAGSVEQELKDLRYKVQQQDKRIKKLERLLSSPAKVKKAKQAANSDGWRKPSNWTRVKKGMSYSQVKRILGKPTRTQSITPYVTYYYTGYIPNSGDVIGKVTFNDGRMSYAEIPVF